MLSKSAIEEFQKIYLQQFGQEISPIEAKTKAEALIRFYKIIFKPEFNQQLKSNKEKT